MALILGFILGVGAILFILQNNATVALSFYQWQFETSLALVVLISLLVGAVLALLITIPGAIGSSLNMRRLRKHNEMLAREAEVQRQLADAAKARLASVNNSHIHQAT